ncbi:leukemia inhibitory factor receptor [Aulostomus maculatus]
MTPGCTPSEPTFVCALQRHLQVHETITTTCVNERLYGLQHTNRRLNTVRCGPPLGVNFSRRSGSLDVRVSWPRDEARHIKKYSVRYKAPGGSESWNQSLMGSLDAKNRMVENLNASLVYLVQIRCDTNKECTQCLWSCTYTVQPELTAQPAIIKVEDRDLAETKGSRMLSLTWTFRGGEQQDGFSVTIEKESGEGEGQQFNTTKPEISLILSYSAYRVNISAFNRVSVSPAVSRAIPSAAGDMSGGELNVTTDKNTSFTLYWKDNLIKKYICYCAEWSRKGHRTWFMSFYQNKKNQRTLSRLPEPLEPYTRYNITLHTRPDRDTCNLKRINNSESTYGSTQFYFLEGSPLSGPANITYHNVTLTSMALQWSPIPEQDVRGFLLGYVIYYTASTNREAHGERNVTVAPHVHSHKLEGLQSGTVYQVQLSGFTRAGMGVRSIASHFQTIHPGYLPLSTIITSFSVVVILVIFTTLVLKRAKPFFWPSVPNPRNSHAIQKIERPAELDLLEPIALKVEEWDTNSLQIIEEQPAVPVSALPSAFSLLCDTEGEEMSCDRIQTDTDDATGDTTTNITADTSLDLGQTNLPEAPLAFTGDYTTMEMFQQGVLANTAVTQVVQIEDMDFAVVKSGYVRPFSSSPVPDNEDASQFCGIRLEMDFKM